MSQFRAWVEVDLAAIRANVREIRRHIGPVPEIIGVVKANGYGHGAVEVGQELISSGVTRLAVATVSEAVDLRAAQIAVPILILGPVLTHEWTEVLRYRLSPCLLSLENLAELIFEAQRDQACENPLSVHVMLNTGMNRFGFGQDDFIQALELIAQTPELKLHSLMSHFQHAEDSITRRQQRQTFMEWRADAIERGLAPENYHLANSAGTIFGDCGSDPMVRPGLALYGIDPVGDFAEAGVDLMPALTVKSRLAHIRDVKPGQAVGYGTGFTADKSMKVGIISIGYGDGWPYSASNNGDVLIREKRCPIIGSVMMDAIAVDVSEIGDLETGEEVVLLGRQGFQTLTASEIAARIKTLVYQIPCQLGQRLSRQYLQSARSALQQTG